MGIGDASVASLALNALPTGAKSGVKLSDDLVVRERPGSQGMASTSQSAVDVTDDIDPEDHLLLGLGFLFKLIEVRTPIDLRHHFVDVGFDLICGPSLVRDILCLESSRGEQHRKGRYSEFFQHSTTPF